MRRRLIDLCLLAYPRARREQDHRYLRDLALELSDAYGLRRQAMSLVLGGLRERMECLRIGRVVVGCSLVAALAVAASGLVGTAAGDAERVEAGELVCVDTGLAGSKRDRDGACSRTTRLVDARERGGWDCAMRRHTRDGRRAIAWRCTM